MYIAQSLSLSKEGGGGLVEINLVDCYTEEYTAQ